MEKVMNILKPKPNPQQLLRDWQRRLRQECRNIERQIRDIQREEKNVQKSIKEAAKRNDMSSAKTLAKEIVRSRKTVNRLYENKAQLNSISMHLGESVAIARTVRHLSKSAEVMKLVNNLMKAPQMAVTMQEFSNETTKAGVIEEMVNEAVGDALDSEDIEEETEEEIEKVLTAIAGETAAQLPEAVRKEKLKQYAAFSELLPLLAAGSTPFVKVERISQSIDSSSLTIENATTISSPVSALSFSAIASFEVRSPSRIQVEFKEGKFKPPEIKSAIDESISIFGQNINLSPVQQSLNPLHNAVEGIARTISGQPPLKIPIPGERTKSWLLITYLDKDLRISRGDGGLFVLVKEGSPLLY